MVATLATGALVTAACSTAPAGGREGPGAPFPLRPVRAAAPADPDPPSSHVSGDVCVVTRPVTTPASAGGLVDVDPGPDAVTAVWLPGLNAVPCTTAETRGDASAAAALAGAVDAGSAPGTGPMSCPDDDGTSVELFFAYPGGAPGEEADVDLTGCRLVSAPGRAARHAGAGLFADLAAIAPGPWKADLAAGTSPIGIGPGPASS